ncbi:MAG: hypothetical protein AAF664_20215 [Planctomycetota bacterium]
MRIRHTETPPMQADDSKQAGESLDLENRRFRRDDEFAEFSGPHIYSQQIVESMIAGKRGTFEMEL